MRISAIALSLILAATAPAYAVDLERTFEQNHFGTVREQAQAMLRDDDPENDAAAHAWLSRVHYRRGQFAEARAELKKAGTSDLQGLLAHGDYALYVGQAHEAADYFQTALKYAPDNLHALWGLGSAYLNTMQLDQALELAERAKPQAERAGGYQLSHVLTVLGGAQALKAQQGLLDAIRYGPQVRGTLERAVEAAPKNGYAHLALGRFYLEAPAAVGGDPQEGVQELEQAVNLNPNYYMSRAWLIRAYRQTGQDQKAEAEIQRYRQLYAGLPAAMQELRRIRARA